MAMYIEPFGGSSFPWHVGEPLPTITTKVVTFQADGDELELILKAMRESGK